MSAGGAEAQAWQVLVDCPHCRTEGAVLELFDPAHPAAAFGVPADRRCRLCGWHEVAEPAAAGGGCPGCGAASGDEATEAGRCTTCGYAPPVRVAAPPADLTDPAAARAALARWAAEDGEADLDVFCSGGFGGDPDAIVAKLVAGEPVPTMFDVVAFLFPSGGGGAPVQRAVERRTGGPVAPVEPAAAAAPSGVEGPLPTLAGRALASVMAADGVVKRAERQAVDQFLARHGLPALTVADLRVWRPSELGPRPDAAWRDQVLEAAVMVAHVDGQRDDAEWRVVRAFAAAWGAPEARLATWDRQYERRFGSAFGRVGRVLNRWFGG